MNRKRLPLIAVTVCLTIGLTPEAAGAATTFNPPYPRSESGNYCDLGAVCTNDVGAKAATGSLLVELSAVGTQTYEPRVCAAEGWDPECSILGVRPAGAVGSAWVAVTHTVPSPVGGLTITATVEIDDSTAESSTGDAFAWLWAGASSMRAAASATAATSSGS